MQESKINLRWATAPEYHPSPRSCWRRVTEAVILMLVVTFSYLQWHLRFIQALVYPGNSIFDRVPLIDGHNDFPIWIRAYYQNHIYQDNFTQDAPLYGQVDFPRLRQSRLGGQFWSVYVECPNNSSEYSDSAYREIIHDTLQQIDLVYRLIEEYPSDLVHARTAADVYRQFGSGDGRISSLLGIEGLHQIGNSVSILRMYHALGVRYATLTHTCHNAYADSEAPAAPLHGGLSARGWQLVREMNRLGMAVDLSHTSAATQRDAIAASAAPVMFSHSNAYARYHHSRNVPDDVLAALRRNGGIVMVTFYPAFLEADPAAASLDSVADHIQSIGEAIGYRHVGIGSDFDGMPAGPRGLEDVTRYPDLISALQDRGLASADIAGIMGLNVLRVLEAVECVSEQMRDVRPLEDDVKAFFGA
ncbi:hypothetical protein PFICI_09668 [Pestalotiopsis fici W106-1]|uniref:Dipeptidase n=1 Tax=Pestalotiopsis fici (strain W106-1 / CGMCC3.15140) TaxID=1229662 RepID=W3WXJ2_PESFW|nr:uncharacterized protein PFICI_09668 [Pestalotiopsis fici W106-1]ETS77606.1 hypothetical protein PFICI_09668 [Pestalotiopsis fici W106-1]